MRKVLSAACVGAMATFAIGAAYANDELAKMAAAEPDSKARSAGEHHA